jgi:hypothetical protein
VGVVKSSKATGVVIELASDGRYVVRHGDTVFVSTAALSLAEIVFQEAVDERMIAARARLARERAHFDIQAVRSEAFRQKRAKATRKGGKGGSGGVGG